MNSGGIVQLQQPEGGLPPAGHHGGVRVPQPFAGG